MSAVGGASFNFDTPKTNLLAKYDDEFTKYVTDPKYASALTFAREMALSALPKNEKEPSPKFDKAFSDYEDLILTIRREKAFAPQQKASAPRMKWILIIVAIIIVLLAIAIPLIIYFKKEPIVDFHGRGIPRAVYLI